MKRISAKGALVLYTWDQNSRVVRIDGMAGRFDPRSEKAPVTDEVAWTHCFTYNEKQELVEEIDCVGNRHVLALGEAPKIDLERGTALNGHVHIRPEAKPTAMRVFKIEYDNQGRVKVRK